MQKTIAQITRDQLEEHLQQHHSTTDINYIKFQEVSHNVLYIAIRNDMELHERTTLARTIARFFYDHGPTYHINKKTKNLSVAGRMYVDFDRNINHVYEEPSMQTQHITVAPAQKPNRRPMTTPPVAVTLAAQLSLDETQYTTTWKNMKRIGDDDLCLHSLPVMSLGTSLSRFQYRSLHQHKNAYVMKEKLLIQYQTLHNKYLPACTDIIVTLSDAQHREYQWAQSCLSCVCACACSFFGSSSEPSSSESSSMQDPLVSTNLQNAPDKNGV